MAYGNGQPPSNGSNPKGKAFAEGLAAIAALITIVVYFTGKPYFNLLLEDRPTPTGIPLITSMPMVTSLPTQQIIIATPVRVNHTVVNVPADNSNGVPTTVYVHKGDEISTSATGTWCWGGDVDCSDADGTPGRPAGPQEGKSTLQGQRFGTLIGHIGGSFFPIGKSSTTVAPEDGELLLLMNDRIGTYSDNSRAISVEVTLKQSP